MDVLSVIYHLDSSARKGWYCNHPVKSLLPVDCLYARNTNQEQHRLYPSTFMFKRLLSAKCVYVIHWWLDCRPGWSKDATWTASKKLCKVCLPCHRSWRDPEPSCYWHPPTQCTSPHVCSLDAAFVKASSLPTFLQQLPKHWLVLICNVELVFVCQSLCFALKKLGFHSTAPVACVLWHDSVPKLRTNTNILCICLLQGRCPSHLNIPCCKLRNSSRSVLPNTSVFAGF